LTNEGARVRSARWTALAISAFLLYLPGCHRSATLEPQYILLTFNGGACQQNGTNGVVEVSADQPVIYQGASGMLTQFQVQFTICPFASCPVNSPAGDSANVGKPLAASAGATFRYSGMSINNQRCIDADTMGLRVRPGS
jgi:hypothetical protein